MLQTIQIFIATVNFIGIVSFRLGTVRGCTVIDSRTVIGGRTVGGRTVGGGRMIGRRRIVISSSTISGICPIRIGRICPVVVIIGDCGTSSHVHDLLWGCGGCRFGE